jgi:L-iditol 2-dehydrogenase
MPSLSFVKSGFLPRSVSHRFGLNDAAAAIDLASHPKADSMKIVLKL